MLLIFIAGVLWGTIGLFVKGLSSLGASPALICVLRISFAFVIMLAVSLFRHGRGIILTDRKALISCVLLGLVSQGAFNIFYTESIRINGMGIACVLMYTAPVFTAIASRIFFRERFSRVKVCALLVNIIGCILTVTGGDFSGSGVNVWGVIMGLGSGFGYGMAAIFGRMAGERTEPDIVSMYSNLAGALFLFAFLRPELSASGGIVGLAFLYALIPTAIAYLVYYIGLKKVDDTSRVPVIASIEPVTAVLLGTMVYGERIGTANFIGVAVVLISIIIMAKSE
ncbi:MAG: EamA family transporter [Synergistaceae bacterium]|nr:EamA family transporter [Synergistaceae bacterium]